MTNAHHTVLYVGVTSAIGDRVEQHITHYFKNSFTDKYNCDKLVYLEHYTTVTEATAREKQMKKYSRKRKEALINGFNPEWNNLLDILSD